MNGWPMRAWGAICLAMAACGYPMPHASGDAAPGDTAGSDTGDAAPLVTTIRQLRMSPPPTGTSVVLHGVVVVARVTSVKRGSVWVQDPGGGTYSGIELFCSFNGGACAMTKASVDALAIGGVVDVTGVFAPFLSGSAPAGAQPTLEIDVSNIVPTGATAQPAAIDVPVATIIKTNLGPGSSDPYKGTYVHVTGASSFGVGSNAAAEFSGMCTDTSTPPQTGMTYFGFDATGAGSTLAVGFSFFNTLTYCEPCTGVTNPVPCTNQVVPTDTFTTVRGIVEPAFNLNGMVYLQLSPTADSDLVR